MLDLGGHQNDATPPTQDDVERRRSLLKLIFSAADAHAWSVKDRADGKAYVAEMDIAFDKCSSEVPDLARKLRKKKGGAQSGTHLARTKRAAL